MNLTEACKLILESFFEWVFKQIGNLISKIINNLLIICIKHSNIFLSKCLLAINADINCVDHLGRTLLHIVISDMNLQKGKDIEEIKNEKIKMIHFLISKGFDIERASQIKDANGEIVEITALQYACKTNKVDFVRELIELGANVDSKITNSNGATALMYACKNRFNEIAYMLLNNCADPDIADNDGNTPLHEVCSRDDYNMVRVLLKNGANINNKNNNGETPLHIACKKNLLMMTVLLICNGSNIESMSNDKSRPIHYACREGNTDIVRYLLRQHATVNVKTSENDTPLKISVLNNNVTLAETLLKAGANINETYNNRWQVLHFAVKENLFDMVNLLYENGADLESKTVNNMTAYKLARKNKNTVIMDFLSYKINLPKEFKDTSTECKNIAKSIVQLGQIGKKIYKQISR